MSLDFIQDRTLSYLKYSDIFKQASLEYYNLLLKNGFKYNDWKHNYHSVAKNLRFLDETVLWLGIINNQYEIVSIKEFYPTNRAMRSVLGRNAISYAAEFSDINIIKVLIDNNFPVFNRSSQTDNPVLISYKLKKFEVVEYLMLNLKYIPFQSYDELKKVFIHDGYTFLDIDHRILGDEL